MDTQTTGNPETRETETRQIQTIALLGFALNLVLTVMKVVLAVLSGSLAVTASTIDSATDAVASMILYIGLKLSDRKTPGFPLGLYKIENLLSIGVAFFIFLAGYEIARRAFTPTGKTPDISLTMIVLIAMATAAILAFGRYALYTGRRTESPTLIAEGRHRQTDALSSLMVLASLVVEYFNIHIAVWGITIDQMAAIVVLLFIAHTGWELLSDGMRVLLDASMDYDTLSRIQRIIEEEPLVTQVNSLTGRNAGRFRFLQANIVVRTDNLNRAHDISERIEANIRKKVPHVERVVIHYEPQTQEYYRIAVPLADDRATLSSHFGKAPYFAVCLLKYKSRQIEKQEIVKNPHTQLQEAKGIRVAEWLVAKKVDLVTVVQKLKPGPSYVFANGGIKTRVVNVSELSELLSYFSNEEKALEMASGEHTT